MSQLLELKEDLAAARGQIALLMAERDAAEALVGRLRDELQKAHDTFEDTEQAMRMLRREGFTAAMRIAKDSAAACLADPAGQRAGAEWLTDELIDGTRRIRRWLAEAVFHLLRAYEAGHRKGWEPGPSSNETLMLIHAWLCDKGFDPNDRHTPQFVKDIESSIGGEDSIAAVERTRQP